MHFSEPNNLINLDPTNPDPPIIVIILKIFGISQNQDTYAFSFKDINNIDLTFN